MNRNLIILLMVCMVTGHANELNFGANSNFSNDMHTSCEQCGQTVGPSDAHACEPTQPYSLPDDFWTPFLMPDGTANCNDFSTFLLPPNNKYENIFLPDVPQEPLIPIAQTPNPFPGLGFSTQPANLKLSENSTENSLQIMEFIEKQKIAFQLSKDLSTNDIPILSIPNIEKLIYETLKKSLPDQQCLVQTCKRISHDSSSCIIHFISCHTHLKLQCYKCKKYSSNVVTLRKHIKQDHHEEKTSEEKTNNNAVLYWFLNKEKRNNNALLYWFLKDSLTTKDITLQQSQPSEMELIKDPEQMSAHTSQIKIGDVIPLCTGKPSKKRKTTVLAHDMKVNVEHAILNPSTQEKEFIVLKEEEDFKVAWTKRIIDFVNAQKSAYKLLASLSQEDLSYVYNNNTGKVIYEYLKKEINKLYVNKECLIKLCTFTTHDHNMYKYIEHFIYHHTHLYFQCIACSKKYFKSESLKAHCDKSHTSIQCKNTTLYWLLASTNDYTQHPRKNNPQKHATFTQTEHEIIGAPLNDIEASFGISQDTIKTCPYCNQDIGPYDAHGCTTNSTF